MVSAHASRTNVLKSESYAESASEVKTRSSKILATHERTRKTRANKGKEIETTSAATKSTRKTRSNKEKGEETELATVPKRNKRIAVRN